jgi:DNA mismatch endonuclease, patch repair protein
VASTPEPPRERPAPAVSARFSRQRRSGTRPELELRSELHRRGLRFRVHMRVEGLPRRRVDIAFTRPRLIVFVDGCFWHGCPQHGISPRKNPEWWQWKLAMIAARDTDTDVRLRELGWTVLRIWEHVDASAAADVVQSTLSAMRESDSTRSPRG